jgi:hypothetical protein
LNAMWGMQHDGDGYGRERAQPDGPRAACAVGAPAEPAVSGSLPRAQPSGPWRAPAGWDTDGDRCLRGGAGVGWLVRSPTPNPTPSRHCLLWSCCSRRRRWRPWSVRTHTKWTCCCTTFRCAVPSLPVVYELLKLGALVGELVYRSSGSQEGRCAPCAMSPTRWLLLVSYVEPEPYVAAPNPCPLQMNLGVLDAKSMAAALMAIAEGLGARSGQILMPQVRLL